MNVNVVERWKSINGVIKKVENTRKLRDMHYIKFYTLFRQMQHGIVSENMMKWRNECNEKNIRLSQQAVKMKHKKIDKQYALVRTVVKTIQSYV